MAAAQIAASKATFHAKVANEMVNKIGSEYDIKVRRWREDVYDLEKE